MKIIFGSDEKTSLTTAIYQWLKNNGHSIVQVGHLVDEDIKWKWAEIGKSVGERISKGEGDFGIICCWSGTGVCMAANRMPGARAALCWDVETAKLARKWNNANVLCLSLRFTSETLVKEILSAWFDTEFDEEGLHQVDKLDE